MTYKLFEHGRVKKFFKKHKKDKKLLLRISGKYYEILDDPYNAEFIELSSAKCPKCQRARVGSYRIIFYLKNARIPRLLKSGMNRKFRDTFVFTSFL
jgi:mRNA-degrading endonuclease RelE of RelBE toxin-antitoxin system